MAAPLLRGAHVVGYDATAFKRTQNFTELEGRTSLRQRYPLQVRRYESSGLRLFDDTAPRLRFTMARPAELKGGEWESLFIN
jgi:hypothetical protein